jgi:hypothetical protein
MSSGLSEDDGTISARKDDLLSIRRDSPAVSTPLVQQLRDAAASTQATATATATAGKTTLAPTTSVRPPHGRFGELLVGPDYRVVATPKSRKPFSSSPPWPPRREL